MKGPLIITTDIKISKNRYPKKKLKETNIGNKHEDKSERLRTVNGVHLLVD